MEGYRLDVDTAEEFFNRCAKRGAVTEAERVAVLEELVQELRAIRLNEKDIENQTRGKNVLKIGFKGDKK